MGAVASVPWLRTALIAVLLPPSSQADPRSTPPQPPAALRQQPSDIAATHITTSKQPGAASGSGSGVARVAPAPDTSPTQVAKAEPTVSLGAGLFSLLAAPGFEVPGEEPPGAWLVLFLEGHADQAVFTGLFCTSRGAKAWCLQHAPRARLTLRKHVAWKAKLAAARDALRVRGALPTCLAIQLPSTSESHAALADVPGAVAGVGHGITTLEWHMALFDEAGSVRSGILLAISPHIPNLTTLLIDSCVLPPPNTFPHLKQLSVWGVRLDACPSIAKYLPQITTLTLVPQITTLRKTDAVCRAVFSTASSTLTDLDISFELTDQLLGLLVSRTPALTALRVGLLRVQSDAYVGKEWGVKTVHAAGDGAELWGRGALDSVQRLPVNKAGATLVLK